ncbi:MAG: hypothetical protein ACI87W_002273 [Halieaceae bacterium]|jgi:uncharacterized protein (DUF885 family)
MSYRVLKAGFLVCALALLGAACSVSLDKLPMMSSGESDFRAFLDSNWQEDLALNPMFASSVGVKDYQDRWGRLDEAFLQEEREREEQRLAALAQFDRASLSEAEQLSYDLYELSLQRNLASDEFRHEEFVIDQHGGPHTSVPSNLINIHRISDRADAEAYIARLQNVRSYFDGLMEQLEIRSEKGLLLADWQYPPMIDATRNVIRGVPFEEGNGDSALWTDFSTKLIALNLLDSEQQVLLDAARLALRDSLAPAYERLIVALQKQAAAAPDADGVWKFPDGGAFYAERLRWFTTTSLNADQVHEIGLREVARIQQEMRGIMRQVDFEGDLQDFFAFMREDPQFYYPNTDEGREAYLGEARALINDMYAQLPTAFGLLPNAEISVKRVEAFRERSAGKAFYQAPPPDGSRPGIYYANLYNMADMPKYQMAALAFHEGVPGHHMQRAISVELTAVPDFQKYASFTAYTEGWGLYSETLAGEMGFYQDPYSDFGRLAMELWRACRLVVDTGIHSKRWTREEAIDYLRVNTPNPEGDVVKAIERYIAMPGQATAYMIGKLKIMELRERARVAMGDAFDLRAFHDLVLEDGPVPLSILEAKVDRMIRSEAAI